MFFFDFFLYLRHFNKSNCTLLIKTNFPFFLPCDSIKDTFNLTQKDWKRKWRCEYTHLIVFCVAAHLSKTYKLWLFLRVRGPLPFWSESLQDQSRREALGNAGTGRELLSADPFPTAHSLSWTSPAQTQQCNHNSSLERRKANNAKNIDIYKRTRMCYSQVNFCKKQKERLFFFVLKTNNHYALVH